jgi:hypothetical protein
MIIVIGSLGKILIIIGVLLIAAGVLFILGGKLGLGRLPGDIVFKKGNFTFYFPLMTGIIISVVLTILFNIIRKLK